MGIKKRVARSSSLPLLALRGLVVFPGMLLHFDVGRQKSIQALNASMGADQIIYLVTQRDVAQDDPSVEGLYTVCLLYTSPWVGNGWWHSAAILRGRMCRRIGRGLPLWNGYMPIFCKKAMRKTV